MSAPRAVKPTRCGSGAPRDTALCALRPPDRTERRTRGPACAALLVLPGSAALVLATADRPVAGDGRLSSLRRQRQSILYRYQKDGTAHRHLITQH